MKKNLYAVIDTASGVYDGPIPGQSDGQMIRSFSDMAVNAEHPIGQHPTDRDWETPDAVSITA